MDLITLAMAKGYTDKKAGGGLPVIEISGESEAGFYDEYGGKLTAEEAAAFDTAVSARTPVIVRTYGTAILCSLDDGGGYSGLMVWAGSNGIGLCFIIFEKNNNVWKGKFVMAGLDVVPW